MSKQKMIKIENAEVVLLHNLWRDDDLVYGGE